LKSGARRLEERPTNVATETESGNSYLGKIPLNRPLNDPMEAGASSSIRYNDDFSCPFLKDYSCPC